MNFSTTVVPSSSAMDSGLREPDSINRQLVPRSITNRLVSAMTETEENRP
jgi:hypothetical protein